MTAAQLVRLEACRAAGQPCANRWQQGNGKTPLVCGFIMAETECPHEATTPVSEGAQAWSLPADPPPVEEQLEFAY